jgi:phosphoglycerate dehydrogenase-like enzyme
MFGLREFAMVKHGITVINAAGGGIIAERALLANLI